MGLLPGLEMSAPILLDWGPTEGGHGGTGPPDLHISAPMPRERGEVNTHTHIPHTQEGAGPIGVEHTRP